MTRGKGDARIRNRVRQAVSGIVIGDCVPRSDGSNERQSGTRAPGLEIVGALCALGIARVGGRMLCVIIDGDRCTGCELCTYVCPRDLLAIDLTKTTRAGDNPASFTSTTRCRGCDWANKPVHRCNCGWDKDETLCDGCRLCVDVCPQSAITIKVVHGPHTVPGVTINAWPSHERCPDLVTR